MNTISFMSANYVAREVGYHLDEGWMQGDAATNAYFSPLETFGERFDTMLAGVSALGFGAIDLWTAHLNPAWATPEHFVIARDKLAKNGLTVSALAGAFGDTLEEFTRSCEVAKAVGAYAFGGGAGVLKTHPAETVALLKEYGLKLGLENHPEKTPAELLARIGDGGDGTIGAALDTGWFATQGFPPAEAITALAPHLVAIHLKDIKAPRAEKTGFMLIDMGHETCMLGEGICDIPACVAALKAANYTGSIAVEHEPEEFNPDADCRESLTRLKSWLA